MLEQYEKDVHTEHCCLLHGCKYGDDECSVVNEIKQQSHICETCMEDRIESINEILKQYNVISKIM